MWSTTSWLWLSAALSWTGTLAAQTGDWRTLLSQPEHEVKMRFPRRPTSMTTLSWIRSSKPCGQ